LGKHIRDIFESPVIRIIVDSNEKIQ